MEIKNIVIASGGFGTRMKDVLGDIPKVLAPINNRPFLMIILDKYEEIGITGIHLLLGFKANEIWAVCQKWLDEKAERRNKIMLSATIEPKPMGIWSSLMLAREFLPEVFMVTYGDVFPTVDISAIGETFLEESDGCMAVCPQNIACEPGNVAVDGNKIIEYSKDKDTLQYVDVGAIIVTKKTMPIIKDFDNKYDDFISRVISGGKMQAYVHPYRSKHIGDPEAYNDLINWLKK
jgi:D-glycero-alpha-D-manno-heptose 1-phosphate guanylyltransferase